MCFEFLRIFFWKPHWRIFPRRMRPRPWPLHHLSTWSQSRNPSPDFHIGVWLECFFAHLGAVLTTAPLLCYWDDGKVQAVPVQGSSPLYLLWTVKKYCDARAVLYSAVYKNGGLPENNRYPPCPVSVVVILIPRRNVNTCHWGWRIPRLLPGRQRYTAAPNPFLLFQILFWRTRLAKQICHCSNLSTLSNHSLTNTINLNYPFIFTKLPWSIFFVEAIRCLKVVCFLAEIQLPTTASVFFYFSLS